MNKESLIAVLLGLVLGSSLFVFFKRAGSLVGSKAKNPPQPTIIAAPTVVEVDESKSRTKTEGWFKLVNPVNHFLVKTKQIEFRAQTASGGGVLVRVNDDLSYYPAQTSTVSGELKLEAGANLVVFTGLDEKFNLSQPVFVSGVVSSQNYPESARALAGQVIKVAGDVISIKADDQQVIDFNVKPTTKLYSFTQAGRRVTLTAVDDKLIEKSVLVIFTPTDKEESGAGFDLIKLLSVSDWQVKPQRLFEGKVTKIDDDKSKYQVADINNQVEEVTLSDKVKIFSLNGRSLKREDLSLSDKVLLYYLGDKVGLVLVYPQVNLLED